jgi:hypothetical protein
MNIKNYPDIMLDLETLATTPNAKILSISAVAFDPHELSDDLTQNPKLDLLLDLDEQENRYEDPDTVEWWAKQSHEVQNKIFSDTGRVKVDDAISQLSKFVWNKDRLWAQGIAFDFPILENLFRERKNSIPWQYYKVTDSRTIRALVDCPVYKTSHDSLDDCYNQIKSVQYVLHELGITKFVR